MMRQGIFAIAALLLAACGGGGGSGAFIGAGGSGGDSGTGGDGSTSSVASVVVLSDKAEIPSSGSSNATITALVRDSDNNAVSGQLVQFSTSSGVLQVTQPETDASGQAVALLSTAGDKENRVITVTATAGRFSSAVNVAVAGTRLTLNGPAAMVLNDTASFEAILEDSDGNGIGNETVSISSDLGNALSSSSLQTNVNGRIGFDMTANVAGTDRVRASALGLEAVQVVEISNDTFVFQDPAANLEVPLNTDQDVRVLWQQAGVNQNGQTVNFSTTRGVLAAPSAVTANGEATTTIRASNAGAAVITASVAGGPSTQVEIEFVATAPAAISVQAEPLSLAPNASSTVTAVVRDANGNFVKNQNIVFQLTDVSGGSLSQGSAVTDSLGRAQTTYTASAATSSKDGVRIDATVSGTPSVTGAVFLTVADQPVHITIGSGNEVVNQSSTRYGKPYLLIVNDADGNPLANTEVQLSITALSYAKGCWELAVEEGETQPLDCGGNGGTQGAIIKTWVQVIIDVCANEDVDEDGFLDTGEDFNNSGTLEPGRPAVVPGSITTGDDGTAEFTVDYPKDRSNWVAVRLTAKREVAGSESSATSDFVLPVIEEDVSPTIAPPGNPSPYGIQTCGNAG